MDDVGSLAQRLRWARQQQGVTLQHLSERCGRAVSYLSQLEHGVKVNPTKQTVESMAEALGVRPAFLFGEVPNPPFDDRSATLVSGQAFTLGQRFRTYWLSLPEVSRWDMALAPSDWRFSLVVRFLLDQFPQNFTPLELAWRLGMSLGQFRDILEQGEEVSHTYMLQMSRLSGVPMTFFTHGALDPEPQPAFTPEEALRYVEAIRLALARKVSPERLEALIRAVADGDDG